MYESVRTGRGILAFSEDLIRDHGAFWPKHIDAYRLCTYDAACTSEPIQIAVQGTEDCVLRLRTELNSSLGECVTHVYRGLRRNGKHLLDIFVRGVSKASGLQWLAEHHQIPMNDTVAFGGSPPDACMLSPVGLGVAMGNAGPEVRAAATMVAPTNDEDGVAVIREQLLEQGLMGSVGPAGPAG